MIHFLENFLKNNWTRILPNIKTPNKFHFLLAGNETTRNKIVLIFADGEPTPFLAAKVARHSKGARALKREFSNLSYVTRRISDSLKTAVPKPICLEKLGNDTVLVETVLSGKTLEGRWRQEATKVWLNNISRDISDATQLLIMLQKELTDKKAQDRSVQKILENAWGTFCQAYKASEYEKEIKDTITDQIQNWGRQDHLPVVFSHGDFWAGNLLQHRHEMLGLVDWEFARRDGLPFWDLFLFLSSVAAYSPWAQWGINFTLGFRHTFAPGSKVLQTFRESLATYARQMNYPQLWIAPLYKIFLLEMSAADYRQTGTVSEYDLNWRNALRLFHNVFEDRQPSHGTPIRPDDDVAEILQKQKFVFICGVHRSGTSILTRCLREHPSISGFRDTGVFEDEGQHLQTVMPAPAFYGGLGKFGFNPAAHLCEESKLLTEANRIQLIKEWKPYWDTRKPVLLEKSPANLIRTRYLQAMFENSFFVIITRHPVAVAYSTQKGTRTTPLTTLLRHWIHCHKLFVQDRPFLKNCLTLRFEDFVQQPQLNLDKIYSFLGLERYTNTVQIGSHLNNKYFEKWERFRSSLFLRAYYYFIIRKYETQINEFGYSLHDVGAKRISIIDTAPAKAQDLLHHTNNVL